MMAHRKNLIASVDFVRFSKSVLAGAGIAFILILLFILPVEGKPEWGKWWMIRPLIIVPIAGAGAGALYYFMGPLRRLGGWNAFGAYAVCLVVYVFALWIGTVLGLDGTLWN